MGQGHSSNNRRVEDVSMYPEDIQKAHDKVVAMREKLAILKAEGKANKKKRKKQIKVLLKEKMELHVTLMKLGKHAQRHFSFWEYVRIIRSTFSSMPAPQQIQQGSTNTNAKKEVPKTKTIVKQSDAVQYTIFAFYEAYLLKKLHIAMMLKTQKKLHAKGWNDMVMFLYYEIPKIQTSFEKAEAKIAHAQSEEVGHKSHVEKLYNSHIQNQKNLMIVLQEGVEGKSRAAPEGTEYSFRKKKDEVTVGSSRSLANDSAESSSRSMSSTGTGSGSFRKKEVRSSVFGPAYEAGSSKKEAYQAPWMKNSRNKLAKSVEKAQTPQEEAAAAAKSATPASSPFNRAAKFQSSFKKNQAPQESVKEEEPEPKPPKKFNRAAKFQSSLKKNQVVEESVKEVEEEEQPVVKEEPETEPILQKPEPVKDEPVVKDDDNSPGETEATDKLTEAEEEVTKKKKLPKGMPETLEIDTASGDEYSLDGDTAGDAPVKKKKKKKKKKKVGLAESEDEDLEGGGVVKKKKKKKKKKVGVSSNSSVVSELSNGSNLPH
ncbi:MAG: hypothetical protein SGBAC_006603 [Bacillariaceae sp.]